MNRVYTWDNWRECITCGRQFDANKLRYGPGAMECRDCSRGLVPDPPLNGGPPSPEYLTALKQSRLEAGLCGECGTPPNGDSLQDGLCRACVLAQEHKVEEVADAVHG